MMRVTDAEAFQVEKVPFDEEERRMYLLRKGGTHKIESAREYVVAVEVILDEQDEPEPVAL